METAARVSVTPVNDPSSKYTTLFISGQRYLCCCGKQLRNLTLTFRNCILSYCLISTKLASDSLIYIIVDKKLQVLVFPLSDLRL